MTIQNKVNEIISTNIDVTDELISRDEASRTFNIDKLPKEVGETLRVVKVGDYDKCLCIGDHVKNTSEISTFKIISTNFDNGVLRIRYKLIKSWLPEQCRATDFRLTHTER